MPGDFLCAAMLPAIRHVLRKVVDALRLSRDPPDVRHILTSLRIFASPAHPKGFLRCSNFNPSIDRDRLYLIGRARPPRHNTVEAGDDWLRWLVQSSCASPRHWRHNESLAIIMLMAAGAEEICYADCGDFSTQLISALPNLETNVKHILPILRRSEEIES